MLEGRGSEGLLWTAKHAPKSVQEVVGNDEIRDYARKWAAEIQRGRRQQPLLLWGPPGIGKTALAHALAHDAGWSVVETNAGNIRDRENLAKLIGLSHSARGLFGETRMLLIDEVDAAYDRGQVPALNQILREAMQPTVLTANDPWDPKLADLRAACKMLEMRRVNSVAVAKVLDRVTRREKLDVAREFVAEVTARCNGDVRAAINDLQALCEGKRGEKGGGKAGGREAGGEAESAADFVTARREQEEDVFDAVRGVFKSPSFREALHSADHVDVELDSLAEWIAENIAKEYFDHEIAKAMARLSKADVYAGRIRRKQHFELKRYQRALALAGVGMSKDRVHEGFVAYSYPSSLKMLSTTKKARHALASVAAKVARSTHSSSHEARRCTLPFLAHALAQENAAKALGLDEEEASLLRTLYKPIERKGAGGKKRKC